MTRAKKQTEKQDDKTVKDAVKDQVVCGVNAVTVAKEMSSEVDKLGHDLSELAIMGASLKVLEAGAKVKFINLIAQLVTVHLKPLFTQKHTLRSGVALEFVRDQFQWALSSMNDKVRNAAYDAHDEAVANDNPPLKNRTDHGKSATKSIRNKRDDLQNLAVALTHKNPQISKDAYEACTMWESGTSGQPSWASRTQIFSEGIDALIADSTNKVIVGYCADDDGVMQGRPYLLGPKGLELGKVGDDVTIERGVKPHNYTVQVTIGEAPVNEVFDDFVQFAKHAGRYETACNAFIKSIRKENTPPELEIELVKTVSAKSV